MLAAFERLLGPEHADVAVACIAISNVQDSLGCFRQATAILPV